VKAITEETLSTLDEEDRSIGEIKDMAEKLLPNGVAVHTGGVVTPFRELVESLCANALLPVLFCTESCAVGLNLPTKSVVFSFVEGKGLVKFDGCRKRPLTPSEYRQMAGRAGRRGRDPHGNVLFCMTNGDRATNGDDEADSTSAVAVKRRSAEVATARFKLFASVALQPVEAITSTYVLRFTTLLNLLRFGHTGYVTWFALQTFQQFQSRRAALNLKQLNNIDRRLLALDILGFISPERKLTSLGRASAGLWIGDALLIGTMLKEGALESVSVEEIVSCLAMFAVEPKFGYKGGKNEEGEENERDDEGGEDEYGDGLKRMLQVARYVSDVLAGVGLVSSPTSTSSQHYFENWRAGCLSFKNFKRMLKDSANMMKVAQMWLDGESFANVLNTFGTKAEREQPRLAICVWLLPDTSGQKPGMDAGTVAKAIRRWSKLVGQVGWAARRLGKEALAEKLQLIKPRLQRGLPFMASSLLRPAPQPDEDWDEPDLEVQWSVCPNSIGSVCHMRPADIGFSHSSCSSVFRDGNTVRSTLLQLLVGELSLESIEELRVYWHEGSYYTLGNRRLSVFRLLAMYQEGLTIPVRVVSTLEAERWGWKDKFTSGRWKGAVVLLRETGDIIGKSREQTVFDMEAIGTQANLARPCNTPDVPIQAVEEQQGSIGYWHHLRSVCDQDLTRTCDLVGVTQVPELCSHAPVRQSGPPRRLLDPMQMSDAELARMDMDWSPCKDSLYEQPGCAERNGKPCTRKGCTGVFEKTGEACTFCHCHGSEVIARFEAFRGFARRAAKKNVGTHANRRMGR